MQPAVGQGALDDAVGTHPPVPLPAARSQMHFLARYAQGQQMASARPWLLGFHVPYRLVSVAALAETVAVSAEPALEERGQHLCQRLLDHAIQHRRHTQRALRPVGLRDEHPAHWRRVIRPLHKRGAYTGPVFPAEGREPLDGHPVDAGCTRVGLDTPPSPQQVLPFQYVLHHLYYPRMSPCFPSCRHLPLCGHTAVCFAVSATRSGHSYPVRPFAPSAFTDFNATMASADSPPRLPGTGPPQVRARCFPSRPPHLPPRLNLWASLCCASSPAASALICGSCSSARRFPLAFLPPIGYPFDVGFA